MADGGEVNARDRESLMIIQLRRIFYFDEQKSRDSNALKELKILLKHHTPQSLHGHGKEFDEIFESLVHDRKIQLGNYNFLYDAVSKIDQEAAQKVKDCQDTINNILKEDSNNKDNKMESGMQPKKLPKQMEDQAVSLQYEDEETKLQNFLKALSLPPVKEDRKSEFKQSLENEVEKQCKIFKEEMENRFLTTKHSTQAQVAIGDEES